MHVWLCFNVWSTAHKARLATGSKQAKNKDLNQYMLRVLKIFVFVAIKKSEWSAGRHVTTHQSDFGGFNIYFFINWILLVTKWGVLNWKVRHEFFEFIFLWCFFLKRFCETSEFSTYHCVPINTSLWLNKQRFNNLQKCVALAELNIQRRRKEDVAKMPSS